MVDDDMAKQVEVGFNLPNCAGVLCRPDFATPDSILRLANKAREFGFDSVWVNDHIVTPRELQHLPDRSIYESLMTNAVVAGSVPHITVGIASIILPLRDPVVLAKQLITLEKFFPGRIIVGVVIGKYKSEYEAFGSEIYHQRGRATDEFLSIMHALFTEESVSYAGAFRSLHEADFYPKPTSPQLPPIWVGGNSSIAARRARRFGSAWIMTQEVVPGDITRLLNQESDDEVSTGNEPSVALSVTVECPTPGYEPKGEGSARVHRHAKHLTGAPSFIAEELNAYVRAGVRHLLLDFPADDLDGVEASMGWFTDQIRPLLIRAR